MSPKWMFWPKKQDSGSGEMYLCGGFTSVRGTPRNRAACVDANPNSGTPALRLWHPNCSVAVFAMILSGSDMYLGGLFKEVRGEERNRAACVDTTVTEAHPTLKAWNPNCNGGGVFAMILSGSDMYLGGDFTSVRGTYRGNAACVDATVTEPNPALRAWNPDCMGGVRTMILSGSDMYLSGNFTWVRGTAQNYAACVDATVTAANPTLRAWNPNCDSIVRTMLLSGSDMYLGGTFTSVGGTPRNRAACVDANPNSGTPALREWNPNCASHVLTMVLSGSDMYLGGAFLTVRGEERNRVACVDANPNSADPALRAWNPNCGSTVMTMALYGSDMYLGGNFLSVGGTTRNYAACVDATVTEAKLRAWNPNCNSTVEAMLLVEDDS